MEICTCSALHPAFMPMDSSVQPSITLDHSQLGICNSILPSTHISWHPTIIKSFFLSLFIGSLVHFYLYGLMDSNFTQCVIQSGVITLLGIRLSQIWLVGSLSGWLLYPATFVYLSLSTSLLSDTRRRSRLTSCFSCSCPGICHFSKKL